MNNIDEIVDKIFPSKGLAKHPFVSKAFEDKREELREELKNFALSCVPEKAEELERDPNTWNAGIRRGWNDCRLTMLYMIEGKLEKDE